MLNCFADAPVVVVIDQVYLRFFAHCNNFDFIKPLANVLKRKSLVKMEESAFDRSFRRACSANNGRRQKNTALKNKKERNAPAVLG